MEDKNKLTERQKKEKRREYMKKYYMKRKYNLGNGRTTRCKEKLPSDSITTIKKTKGNFVVSFQ
tara:strand:- start:2261 stop:2452 length:192 start_codon:yes stop_codon:yes gene_type:complete